MTPMTEWPQDRLERFWRGLDVETRDVVSWREVYLGELIVGTTFGSYPEWTILNPHDEDKVPLEVLLDGLGRLLDGRKDGKGMDFDLYWCQSVGMWYVFRGRFDYPTHAKGLELSRDPSLRTAIIAAICSLINIDCED